MFNQKNFHNNRNTQSMQEMTRQPSASPLEDFVGVAGITLNTNPYEVSDQKADYFTTCSEGVANGFGPMFFNVRDPSWTKKNDPLPVPNSNHVVLLVCSLVFITCLGVSLIGFDSFLTVGGAIAIVVCSYVFYLCLACCFSEIKDYIDNMKPFSAYKGTSDNIDHRPRIECYHYQSRSTGVGKNRRSSTVKVVTHTASHKYMPFESIDQSGELQGIFDAKNYFFLQYLPRYYFTDDISEHVVFRGAFNPFVAANRSDAHQDYSHNFTVENHEDLVSYSATGDGSKTRTLFYIFTLLGLGIFYACLIERTIARYEIGILKRLTCR